VRDYCANLLDFVLINSLLFFFLQVGINETLTVNLEMLCDCECEREGHMYEEKSSECNGVGTLKCGVCECYDGFFGKRCECSPHQELTGFDKHFQSCRPDNTSLVDCSGRGTCACGQCECEERENPEEVIFLHHKSINIHVELLLICCKIIKLHSVS